MQVEQVAQLRLESFKLLVHDLRGEGRGGEVRGGEVIEGW
jgi:hypothetical protein